MERKNRVKVRQITDSYLAHKLVEKNKKKINYELNMYRKYKSKTQKNLHRDLIGFAKTRKKAGQEYIGHKHIGGAPLTKPQTDPNAKITSAETRQGIKGALGRITGLTAVGNFISDTAGRTAAFLNFYNSEASQIVEVEIAAKKFINTAIVYKAYLLKIRAALTIIDKKILTPIIVGSIKKKSGTLFTDTTTGMLNENNIKYLYRLANLRDNTFLDYIGKCSFSSLEKSKTRLKLVVDWFNRATGELKPLDRYSGLHYRFFLCKLYKLREAEIEYNFRLQQLTQSLKFINTLASYQILQKYIKIERTSYNNIEIIDIKNTKTAFDGYAQQIQTDMKNQKVNTEAISLDDSRLSKTYYSKLQTIPANIERIKWCVNKCMIIGNEILGLQTEIHRSTGFAPNPELNFVIRTESTKRLKNNAARGIYFDKLNDINRRIDEYVQYLLQSLDSAINYGNQENPSGQAYNYNQIVTYRQYLQYIDKQLNSLSTISQRDFMVLRDTLRLQLLAKILDLYHFNVETCFPGNKKSEVETKLTGINHDLAANLLKSDMSIFSNAGILFDIYGDDTRLGRKLIYSPGAFDKTDMYQLLNAVREYYLGKIRAISGETEKIPIPSGTEFVKPGMIDLRAPIRQQRGGDDLSPAEFDSEPNENYPESMTILPFGYPDDLAKQPLLLGQSGGGLEQEKYSTNVSVSSTGGTTQQVSFNYITLSEQSLQTLYGDIIYLLNNPMFLESRTFFQKFKDFFTRVTKTQATKEVHRIYMNYIMKFDMGVYNFDESDADGQYPSKFPRNTAFNGYPSFVLMKLFWEFVELTDSTNYSDLALLDLRKLIKVRKSLFNQPEPRQFTYKSGEPGYERMVNTYFGKAAIGNFKNSGRNKASIPLSFIQLGLLTKEEILEITNLSDMTVLKQVFQTKVFQIINAQINRIRQDDKFTKQMQTAGKALVIRFLKPEVYKILDDWEKAETATPKNQDTINDSVKKLNPYLTIPIAFDTGSGNPVSGTNITTYTGFNLLDLKASPQIFNTDAILDFTQDFNKLCVYYTSGYRIGYWLSATFKGAKYTYSNPEDIIKDYETGAASSKLSGGSGTVGSADRIAAFNAYTPDRKNQIKSLIRAKFSMMRSMDYNDNYYQLDQDGNIDITAMASIRQNMPEHDILEKGQTTFKKVLLFIPNFLQALVKLGINLFIFAGFVFLIPIIWLVLYIMKDDVDNKTADAELEAWYTKSWVPFFSPVWGPLYLACKVVYTLTKGTVANWKIILELLKKISRTVWSNIAAMAGANITLGKFKQDNIPVGEYEQIRKFIIAASSGDDGFQINMYKNYTIDKAEFAMANTWIQLKISPSISSSPISPKDYTIELAKIICKYLAIYYQNDTDGLQAFKEFLSELNTNRPSASGTTTGATSVDELPDETSDGARLYDLITDLINKNDKHTQTVFNAILTVANFDEFNINSIYQYGISSSGGTSSSGLSEGLGYLKVYGKSPNSIIDYYADTKPEHQLSLLLQVLKLSGCVRLVAALHVIYSQYTAYKTKLRLSSTGKLMAGTAKDLSTDALGSLVKKILNNSYSPGYLGDIRLFMDSCGINLIQYYRTKLVDIINTSRIELTSETTKKSVQTVFNQALTKVLVFLRLNALFTDYIQFKTRYIPKLPSSISAATSGQRNFDWTQIIGDNELDSDGHPIPSSSTGSAIGITCYMFTDIVSTPSSSGTGTIKVKSPYKTYENLTNETGKDTEYIELVITNTKYYVVAGKITSTIPTNINSIEMIIAMDTASSGSTNQYTIFAKSSSMTIQEVQKYMGESIGGFIKIDDVLHVLSSVSGAIATSGATPTGFEPKTVYLDGEGNTIAFVNPYYPTRPQVATITSGTPDPLVFFYPGQEGGNTHKILDDLTTEYYATLFPTYQKLAGADPINLPALIDNPSKWTFSDFIWVAKDSGKITEQSGGASSRFEQSGGAGKLICDTDKYGKPVIDIYKKVACEIIARLNKDNINDKSITDALTDINKLIKSTVDESKGIGKSLKSGGQSEELDRYKNRRQNNLISFYYLYKLLIRPGFATDTYKAIKNLATRLYDSAAGETLAGQKSTLGQTQLNITPVENIIKSKSNTTTKGLLDLGKTETTTFGDLEYLLPNADKTTKSDLYVLEPQVPITLAATGVVPSTTPKDNTKIDYEATYQKLLAAEPGTITTKPTRVVGSNIQARIKELETQKIISEQQLVESIQKELVFPSMEQVVNTRNVPKIARNLSDSLDQVSQAVQTEMQTEGLGASNQPKSAIKHIHKHYHLVLRHLTQIYRTYIRKDNSEELKSLKKQINDKFAELTRLFETKLTKLDTDLTMLSTQIRDGDVAITQLLAQQRTEFEQQLQAQTDEITRLKQAVDAANAKVARNQASVARNQASVARNQASVAAEQTAATQKLNDAVDKLNRMQAEFQNKMDMLSTVVIIREASPSTTPTQPVPSAQQPVVVNSGISEATVLKLLETNKSLSDSLIASNARLLGILEKKDTTPSTSTATIPSMPAKNTASDELNRKIDNLKSDIAELKTTVMTQNELLRQEKQTDGKIRTVVTEEIDKLRDEIGKLSESKGATPEKTAEQQKLLIELKHTYEAAATTPSAESDVKTLTTIVSTLVKQISDSDIAHKAEMTRILGEFARSHSASATAATTPQQAVPIIIQSGATDSTAITTLLGKVIDLLSQPKPGTGE